MTTSDKAPSRDEIVRQVSQSGRNWAAIREAAGFEKPAPLFDQPMEITVAMLRGLRMVDETIVVHGDIAKSEEP